MIVASMKQVGSETIYSYDINFDRIEGITRRRPGSLQVEK